ncbi:M36 family metallopeptidase [Halpernia sp. GG3]
MMTLQFLEEYGTYVISAAANSIGIRPAQYSPDFSVNNYTYGKSNDTTFSTYVDSASGTTLVEPHQIGFLWTTMLWDLHWKYVVKYGYASDVMANTTSGSARVFQFNNKWFKTKPYVYPAFLCKVEMPLLRRYCCLRQVVSQTDV